MALTAVIILVHTDPKKLLSGTFHFAVSGTAEALVLRLGCPMLTRIDDTHSTLVMVTSN